MTNKRTFLAVLLIVPLLAACKGEAPNLNKWVGKWAGPEGTFLFLSHAKEDYQVQIQDLDGLSSYRGKAVADGIAFERNGKTETIHAGNGVTTGMKWLADKKNCLVITPGEGFCRD